MEVEKPANKVIYTPIADYMFTSITAIVPIQLLVYHISNIRRLDVYKSRNLDKLVTVE